MRSVEQLVADRDFTGAITVLEYEKQVTGSDEEHMRDLWLAYCYSHLQQWDQALRVYQRLLTLTPFPLAAKEPAAADPGPSSEQQKGLLASVFKRKDSSDTKEKERRVWTADECNLCIAVCLFAQALDDQAAHVLSQMTPDFQPDLRKRLDKLIKVRTELDEEDEKGERKGSEEKTEEKMESVEQGMCVAACHYLRSQFQDAIRVYQTLVRDYSQSQANSLMALKVYMGICYYRLEYYDVGHELVTQYLAEDSESWVANNVTAAAHFRLVQGQEAAEQQLRRLIHSCPNIPDTDSSVLLVKHNLSVFRLTDNFDAESPAALRVFYQVHYFIFLFLLLTNSVLMCDTTGDAASARSATERSHVSRETRRGEAGLRSDARAQRQ